MTDLERFEIVKAELRLARQYLDEIERNLESSPSVKDPESAYMSGCMANDMVTSIRYHLREFTRSPRL